MLLLISICTSSLMGPINFCQKIWNCGISGTATNSTFCDWSPQFNALLSCSVSTYSLSRLNEIWFNKCSNVFNVVCTYFCHVDFFIFCIHIADACQGCTLKSLKSYITGNLYFVQFASNPGYIIHLLIRNLGSKMQQNIYIFHSLARKSFKSKSYSWWQLGKERGMACASNPDEGKGPLLNLDAW